MFTLSKNLYNDHYMMQQRSKTVNVLLLFGTTSVNNSSTFTSMAKNSRTSTPQYTSTALRLSLEKFCGKSGLQISVSTSGLIRQQSNGPPRQLVVASSRLRFGITAKTLLTSDNYSVLHCENYSLQQILLIQKAGVKKN